MKSLATIQKMAKAGKILSRLVFILCLIAFGFGAALLILFAQAGQTTLPDGSNFAALLRMEGNVTLEVLYAYFTVILLFSAGEAVIAKFAEHYFKRELTDGTPFTQGGADEMKRLGILTICISIGTQCVAAIILSLVLGDQRTQTTAASSWSNAGQLFYGIAFLIVSAILRYGAEMCEGKQLRKA